MATVKKYKGTLSALGRKLHQETTQQKPQKKASAKLTASDAAAVPQQLELDRSVQIAVRLAPELVQRMRDAAYFTPGETLTSLVERGVIAEIERLERARGEAFPRANAPVRKGRPVRRG